MIKYFISLVFCTMLSYMRLKESILRMKHIKTISVGTKNSAKLEAVADLIKEYDFAEGVKLSSVKVDSGVSEQPKSLEETIMGAKNRAKSAFSDCEISVGLESGLMKVPHTKSSFMNVCVCAIFDGENYHIGLSSAFEYPRKVIDLVLEEGMDVSEAFLRSGLTENPKIGSQGGAIGILTKGKLVRKNLTRQSIEMALIHLENPDLY